MVVYEKKDGIYQPRKGEAYALFNCDAPRGEIDAYIQGREIKNSAVCTHDSPKPHELGLELKLEEVKDVVHRRDTDPDLRETIIKESIYATYPEAYRHLMNSAKPTPLRNLKYVISAKNNVDNADACEKLTTVMNDVYLKFGEKKPFTVAVLGKNEGSYGFWTND